ncbi:hypothetical protein N7495_000559 [Penicillium taxi]|uniref:uncharacterized protein n=1 Tax=Penicillium taxi TaxID=168475 RepID=UPI002545837C|nr:uncharacterized protein N7495_000559 [Penicillium taxi]KAJ5907877.1 hypothetical protein N7495_000559 [Penicillium taxi]
MWRSPSAEPKPTPLRTNTPRIIHRPSSLPRRPPVRPSGRRHIIPVDEEYRRLELDNEAQVNAMGEIMQREIDREHEEFRQLNLDQEEYRRLELNNENQVRVMAGIMQSQRERELDRQRYRQLNRLLDEPHAGTRSPVLNLGVSEDGLDLEIARREALGRALGMLGGGLVTRPSAQLHTTNWTVGVPTQDILEPPRRTPSFAPAVGYHTTISARPPSTQSHQTRQQNNARTPEYDDSDITYYRERLGYRVRSPDAEQDDDVWEPLVSTITMDSNIPSGTTNSSTDNTTRDSAIPSDTNPCDIAPTEDVNGLGFRMRRTTRDRDNQGT